MEECQKRGDRFKEPIKKGKISNFSTENFSKKNKSSKSFKNSTGTETQDIRLITFFSNHKTIRCEKNIYLSLSTRTSMLLSP